LVIDGVGHWNTTIPYDVTSVGTKDATSVLETGLAQSVQWFIDEYMPLRFHPGYARQYLGYTILGSTYRKKQIRSHRLNKDAINPNVWTGETQKAALGARPETHAVGGRRSLKVGCTIRMRLPGYINQQRTQVTNNVLRKITKDEGRRIAEHFFKNVADMSARFEVAPVVSRGKKAVNLRVNRQDSANFGTTTRGSVIVTRKQGVT
jgi:hypothetical protein